jgi:hypothetical protein
MPKLPKSPELFNCYRFPIPAILAITNFGNLLTMDISQLPPAILTQVTTAVEDYILANRKKNFSKPSPLEPAQRALLAPFFPSEILDNTRFCFIGGVKIEDPSFYGMARMLGFKDLPDFAQMAAITFVDVVVSHEEFTDSLLFHELVHAVQYSQLGIKEFASRYVQGFVTGGSYEEIPLEKNAYQLEARFCRDKSTSFSVADEVNAWIKEGRL